MPDYEPNQVLATGEYDVVGTRPIRHDGPDKVIGRRAMPPTSTCPACCTVNCCGALIPMPGSGA